MPRRSRDRLRSSSHKGPARRWRSVDRCFAPGQQVPATIRLRIQSVRRCHPGMAVNRDGKSAVAADTRFEFRARDCSRRPKRPIGESGRQSRTNSDRSAPLRRLALGMLNRATSTPAAAIAGQTPTRSKSGRVNRRMTGGRLLGRFMATGYLAGPLLPSWRLPHCLVMTSEAQSVGRLRCRLVLATRCKSSSTVSTPQSSAWSCSYCLPSVKAIEALAIS